ncbi:MAG: efflux RND transporter periplasmic adaptor subunit [Bacteroidota bacterium]
MSKYSLRYTFLYVIILAIAMASCNSSTQQNQSRQNKTPVSGYLAEFENFTTEKQFTGNLLAFEETGIRTPVSGHVVNIHFREGEQVEKGELLVEIDNRHWKAQKQGVEAELAAAQNRLKRNRKLIDVEGVSQEEVEQSESEVNRLKARIEELEVYIDRSQIRAPFRGQLGMRNFSPGAYLSQGDLITRLVQNDRLKVSFDIPAKDRHLVKKDQKVTIIGSSKKDSIQAKVYSSDPEISTSSRSAEIRAAFDNKNRLFTPGNFVNVLLKISQSDQTLLIPATAVTPELNTKVIYIADNGKARRQEVTIGARTPRRVEILSGLSDGDTVITSGLMMINDGSPIRVNDVKAGVEQ